MSNYTKLFFYSVIFHIILITIVWVYNLRSDNKPVQLSKPIFEIYYLADNEIKTVDLKKENNLQKFRTDKILRKKSKLNINLPSSVDIFEIKSSGSKEDNVAYFDDNDFVATKDDYESFGRGGSHSYFESGGLKKIYENNKFYEKLWTNISSQIIFPKAFLDLRIHGQVSVHLNVNSKGVMVGDFLKVNSQNSILELYVLACLAYILKSPIEKEFWVDDKIIPLTLNFKFNSVYSRVDVVRLEKKIGYYVGNIFEFVRTGFVMSKIEQKLQDFYSDYVPPILPIGGGVFIDISRSIHFYQLWKNGDRGFNKWKTESDRRLEKEKNLKDILITLIGRDPKEFIKASTNIMIGDESLNSPFKDLHREQKMLQMQDGMM